MVARRVVGVVTSERTISYDERERLAADEFAVGKLRCWIRVKNLGSSPALHVRATFTSDKWGTKYVQLHSLGPADSDEQSESSEIDAVAPPDPEPYEFCVSYGNLFNSAGLTKGRFEPGKGLNITYVPPAYIPRSKDSGGVDVI